MPDIYQLPPSVVNKIAAGEVIERPASVVKELMENSVDAGARHIDVTVEQGGLELVRVSDDGCGIDAQQLPLAVASHATSKIRSADDLFCVSTLGFRGEALASIAEISRLVLRSRTSAATAGCEIEVTGGDLRDASPCGCPQGTTIEVHNLFYNTPVRRKFLRSTQTEMGHVSEAFTRIALAHPEVHCTLRHKERVVHDLPPCGEVRERVAAFFGSELSDGLIPVASQDGAVSVTGYVASPSHSRANPRMQYLFLNGRVIRDCTLQHALAEAYRGLLLTGRYPIAFLRIDMPAEMVDVNVHPTKLEVRFQESGRLYSQLLGTLRTKFLTTDLTARLHVAAEHDPGIAHEPSHTERLRQDLVQWAKGELASATVAGTTAIGSVAADADDAAARFTPMHAPLELARLERSWRPIGAARDEEDEQKTEGAFVAAELPDAPVAPPGSSGMGRAAMGQFVSALQVHNRYLVTESEDGVVVIDQHALHERILYEQLRAKVLSGELESQNLLVPEPVHLSAAEYAAAMEARESLARLGVRIEPFGGDTLLVTSYPAMLANVSPVEILHDLVEQLLAGGKKPDRRDLVDELLHMVSCKAAIKAGDRLSSDEIAALLEQRHLAQDSHHCPHGRPTALVFTREELDRQFKRT